MEMTFTNDLLRITVELNKHMFNKIFMLYINDQSDCRLFHEVSFLNSIKCYHNVHVHSIC